MSVFNEPLIYILQTLGQLYILVVLLRFILQLVRADFYNPLSQFVVKATQPLLIPLRRVIPGYGGIDFASLALALIVHLILAAAIVTLAGASVANMLGHLLIWCLISLAGLFVKIFFFALIVNVILSWVAPGSHNPGAQLVRQIIEPLLKPIQRMLPDLGGIDISPIFAFLALNLVDMFVIKNLAVQTGMWTIISPFL